jgi:predicted P-loop ATPase
MRPETSRTVRVGVEVIETMSKAFFGAPRSSDLSRRRSLSLMIGPVSSRRLM